MSEQKQRASRTAPAAPTPEPVIEHHSDGVEHVGDPHGTISIALMIALMVLLVLLIIAIIRSV